MENACVFLQTSLSILFFVPNSALDKTDQQPQAAVTLEVIDLGAPEQPTAVNVSCRHLNQAFMRFLPRRLQTSPTMPRRSLESFLGATMSSLLVVPLLQLHWLSERISSHSMRCIRRRQVNYQDQTRTHPQLHLFLSRSIQVPVSVSRRPRLTCPSQLILLENWLAMAKTF